MGLRLFHLVFISLSVVLAAFVVAWATGEYRADAGVQYVVAAVAAAASGVALAVYGAAFQRKTRGM